MKKRPLSLLLAALLCCLLMLPAEAALTPALSGNVQYQSYHDGSCIFSLWAGPVWSYLHPCREGMERVEYIPSPSGARLVAEQYTMDGEIVGQKEIPIELPIFGGFFAGADANFVVFGQKNAGSSDAAEIIRVVRYSKTWVRLDSVSLRGANTQVPFDTGSLRMTEDGAYLYLHTAHKMYSGHQANLTFCVRKSDMTITDVRSAAMNSEFGYVSHSFNQFLALDGGRLVTLDHGDAYDTRCGFLYRHKAINAGGKFLPNFDDGSDLCGERVHILPFRSGGNETGANFGGLAVTSTHYLIAGSSVDQKAGDVDLDEGQRNVFVAAVPKGNFTDSAAQVRFLTNETNTQIFTPQLVQVSENRCLLLWCAGSAMYYVFLRADGTAEGPVYSVSATLSDCAPTVIDGRIWWYSTEYWTYPVHAYLISFGDNYYEGGGVTPTFYCIDPADPAAVTAVKTAGGASGTTTMPANPFRDVEEGAYYYAPVLWAANHTPQITNGTSADRFSPNAVCTRGQVVTFLWRAMGCPKPRSTANPFVDVKSADYFYEPVLWAVENGITNGADASHFNPNGNCTRAHVVTFLWRAHEKPAAGTANPFEDVPAGKYYTDAVLWAVSKNITTGVDAKHFGPDAPCTRAQIVTFLYRDLT